MRCLALLAVLATVALAGCNDFPPGPSPAEPDGTVTPVAVPETGASTAGDPPARPANLAEPLPPGLFPNGTVDLGTLIRGHHEHVSNRSYRFRWYNRETLVNDSGQTVVWNGSLTVVTGDGPFRYTFRNTLRGTTNTTYVGPNRSYYRAEHDGTVRTGTTTPIFGRNWWEFGIGVTALGTGTDGGGGDGEGRVRLSPSQVQVRAVERGNETLYRVHVPSMPDSYAVSSTDRYSMTLWVTEQGVIRKLYVRYVVSSDVEANRSVHVTRITYEGVGTTTLDRPEWVREVANRSGSRNGETPNESTDTVTPIRNQTRRPAARPSNDRALVHRD